MICPFECPRRARPMLFDCTVVETQVSVGTCQEPTIDHPMEKLPLLVVEGDMQVRSGLPETIVREGDQDNWQPLSRFLHLLTLL